MVAPCGLPGHYKSRSRETDLLILTAKAGIEGYQLTKPQCAIESSTSRPHTRNEMQSNTLARAVEQQKPPELPKVEMPRSEPVPIPTPV